MAEYDCFISYASADIERARRLHDRLAAAGFSVWFDKARLRPGFNWYREIEQGCEASRIVLPILTPSWRLSPWTRFETYAARSVLPLFSEGNLDDVTTPPMSRWQGHAFDPLKADESAWLDLFQHIRAVLDKPVVERLERIVDLPYPTNPHFVGREAEMLAVCETLHQAPSAVLTQGRIHALSALGGVGKTTLASEYARRFRRVYNQIFWVDARLGYEAQFARIFDLLFPHLAQSDIKPADKAVRALAALNGQDDRLLVIDNAEDEVSVQQWIPHVGHCRTLITSRFTGWSAGVRTLNLWVLDPDPARAFLIGRTGRTVNGEERSSCDDLAKELGYLPLALEQAAAYIVAEGVAFTFTEALALYRRTARQLLAAKVLGSTHYPDAVLTTWTATIAKLSPESRAVLRMTSVMAATPIPTPVFTHEPRIVVGLAQMFGGTEAAPPEEGDSRIRSAIQGLTRYSMARSDGLTLQVHNLVQAVEWEDAAPATRQSVAAAAVAALDLAFPDPEDNQRLSLCAILIPHNIVAMSRMIDSDADHLISLLNETAIYFSRMANWSQAEPMFRRVLAILEANLGSDHPEVAKTQMNLATLLTDTERRAEAESLFRRALAVLEAHDYLDVVAVLYNLAGILSDTDRWAEAESMYRRALAVSEVNLGHDHLHLARILDALTFLLIEMNRWDEAVPLVERALAIRETALGADHPDMAYSLIKLAHLLRNTGQYVEAESELRRALAMLEGSLGPDHPEVASVLGNLGTVLGDMNRHVEAEHAHRRALVIREARLGANHPDVATSLGNLAIQIRDTNHVEAEQLYRRALNILETNFGSEHTSIALNLNNLGDLLRDNDRQAEAEPLYRRAIAIRETCLDTDIPAAATSMDNLANLLRNREHAAAEAESLYRQALAIRERTQGPSHPDVAMTLTNLAGFLGRTDRRAEAEALYRRALAICRVSQGSNHPTTVLVRANFLGFRLRPWRWLIGALLAAVVVAVALAVVNVLS